MKIALDYDGTYTLDPTFWQAFIGIAVASGHEVICVTMRYDMQAEQIAMRIPVIYTARQAKKDYCKSLGIEFDVWIDDKPHYIYQGAI